MEKRYIYVLVYDCKGKEIIIASSPNYTVIHHKKDWYDRATGNNGRIKKLYKEERK